MKTKVLLIFQIFSVIIVPERGVYNHAVRLEIKISIIN